MIGPASGWATFWRRKSTTKSPLAVRASWARMRSSVRLSSSASLSSSSALTVSWYRSSSLSRNVTPLRCSSRHREMEAAIRTRLSVPWSASVSDRASTARCSREGLMRGERAALPRLLAAATRQVLPSRSSSMSVMIFSTLVRSAISASASSIAAARLVSRISLNSLMSSSLTSATSSCTERARGRLSANRTKGPIIWSRRPFGSRFPPSLRTPRMLWPAAVRTASCRTSRLCSRRRATAGSGSSS